MSERKSVLDFFPSLFDKKDKIYDESVFELKLMGGTVHTDLIFANVSFKDAQTDKSIKEPVALECKWFTLDENGIKSEIIGVTGAFYQPCADDVGMKILIQAIPVLGLKNYSGNPLEATIGPLIADEKIQKKINGIFEEGKTRFFVKLEKITPMIEGIDVEFPSECELILDRDKLSVELNQTELISQPILNLSDSPQINLVKKSNNIFEITFHKKETIKFSTKNNLERDIITMSLRLFQAESSLTPPSPSSNDPPSPSASHHPPPASIPPPSSSSPPSPLLSASDTIPICSNSFLISSNHPPTSSIPSAPSSGPPPSTSDPPSSPLFRRGRQSIDNMDILLKAEYFNRELLRLSKENDSLKENIAQLKEEKEALSLKNFDLIEKLDNCTNNYYEIDKENEENQKKIEALLNQKLFFLQEIDICKAEAQAKEKIIIKLKEDIHKHKPIELQKGKFRISLLEVEDLKKSVEEMREGIANLQKERDEIKEKFEILSTAHEDLQLKYEEMQSQSNYLKKKYESLCQEKLSDFNLTTSVLNSQKLLDFNNNMFNGFNSNINLINAQKLGDSVFTGSALNTQKSKEDDNFSERKISESKININVEIPPFYATSPIKKDDIEAENIKLNEQMKNLEITIETLKITLSQEINKKNDSSANKQGSQNQKNKTNKSLLHNNHDIQFLQKLANSLTETIADNELALETQKNINKELTRKVEQLEEKLMKHNKLYTHNF